MLGGVIAKVTRPKHVAGRSIPLAGGCEVVNAVFDIILSINGVDQDMLSTSLRHGTET